MAHLLCERGWHVRDRTASAQRPVGAARKYVSLLHPDDANGGQLMTNGGGR